MPMIAYLKRLYLFASGCWIGYFLFKAFTVPDRNPHLSGIVYCTILFTGIAAFGYALLFLVLPWAARRLQAS